jgi:hypothetical protein
MPSQDHNPHRDPHGDDVVVDRGARLKRPDPVATTSHSQAMWSALVALAIVVVMFGVFYDLSSRDHTAFVGPTVTAPQTTGQGSAPGREPR